MHFILWLLLGLLPGVQMRESVSVSAWMGGQTLIGQVKRQQETLLGDITITYADGSVFWGKVQFLEIAPECAYMEFSGWKTVGNEVFPSYLLLEVTQKPPTVYPVLLLRLPDKYIPGDGSPAIPAPGYKRAVVIRQTGG